MNKKIPTNDDEWKKKLTPEEYRILRQKGTERAFTGEYNHHKEKGSYCCKACGKPLFSSEDKYDSGSGWPSYTKPINPSSVACEEDQSLGYERTEVICPDCKSHLGHVFDDGPLPTGKRFCINSACLKFEKKKPTDPD